MRIFFSYLCVQMKKMLKAFPAVFLTTLLFIAGMAALLAIQVKISSENPAKQKFVLGIVGDTEQSYLGFGIYAIEHMDSSRFVLEFVEMEEEKAKKVLEQGELTGYIKIPEDFVESVVRGENKPVTFVKGISQKTIGTEIFLELSDTISTVVTESQAGMYAAQDIYESEEKLREVYDDIEKMNLRYFDVLLLRENMYDIKVTGGTEGISWDIYFLCASIMIFLMFWGMNSASVIVKKDMALGKLLASRGAGAFTQVLGEFLSFLPFMILNVGGVLIPAAVIADHMGILAQKNDNPICLTEIILRIWPVLICVAALLFLLYTAASSLTSGLLMNFVGALAMGYLSGCFYPASFFPPFIRKISVWFPSGVGMKYMESFVKSENTGGLVLILMGYTLIFLMLSVIIRRKKLAG